MSEVSARESHLVTTTAEREEAQDEAVCASCAAEGALNETREIVTGLDLEAERARQQQSYLTEQIQSLGARSAQFVSDQAAITERSQFISQETARLREELRHIEQGDKLRKQDSRRRGEPPPRTGPERRPIGA